MSLNSKKALIELSKSVSRELRRNETNAEKLFWNVVRNRNFENRKFYRQYPFFYDITGKESFFIADFYCFEEKLIVELDGKYHRYKLEEDKHRTEILNFYGLKVLRFSNDDVLNNIDNVLKKIKDEFSE